MTEIEDISRNRPPAGEQRPAVAREEGALALEISEAPKPGIIVAPFLFLIAVYQKAVSPVWHAALGPAAGCRFHPSCSHYAAEALRTHGLLRGVVLAAWRLLRCTPLSAGGLDPVPPRASPQRPHCERIA